MQVTFVANADPSAEAAFLNDYMATPINAAYAEEGSVKKATLETARNNMRGVFAKNVFYAMNLAKYLKVKANGDYGVILNPVTLTYTSTAEFKHQPFEENMPPFDVDITFGAYIYIRDGAIYDVLGRDHLGRHAGSDRLDASRSAL